MRINAWQGTLQKEFSESDCRVGTGSDFDVSRGISFLPVFPESELTGRIISAKYSAIAFRMVASFCFRIVCKITVTDEYKEVTTVFFASVSSASIAFCSELEA